MLTVAAIMLPSASFAETTNIDSILAQLKALQAQILELTKQKDELEKKQKDLNQQQKELKKQGKEQAAELRRTLREGNEGDDVRVLQALLAADPDIYPEALISGYFGKKTAQAVKRFQRKYGLSQVGHVGPQTLKELQKLLGKHPIVVVSNMGTTTGTTASSTTSVQLCTFVPPGHLIAPGWKKKRGDDHKKKHKKDKHDDDGDDDDNETLIPFCKTIPPGILNKLFPNGTTPTTTPPVVDTAAPILSAVSATNVGTTSAAITWTTNEGATTQVEYGLTSAYGTITALDTGLVTNHSHTISGLLSNTTYHFRVNSKDASNNLATSGDMTFTTTAPADTTAPVISGTAVSAIGSTTATVAWSTSEAATGKVYYGPVNPLILSSAINVENTSLVAGHSFGLTGLTASTTYYYVAESKDAGNNVGTSSQGSFTTTQ